MTRTPATLWQRWQQLAEEDPKRESVVHWVVGEEPRRWTRGDLMEKAATFAALLAERGVKPGHVCALIVRHHPDFYPLYFGVEALGALPAVLAYPNPRLHPDKFRSGLAGMARHSGLDWIVTERELEETIRPLVLAGDTSIRGILFPLEAGATESPAASNATRNEIEGASGADAPCLLQHSSGTTGLQKAVVLSHRAVLEHVARYREAIRLRPDDKVVSWLPLYHDMGLIAAFHLSFATGTPLVQMDPFEWIRAPVTLMEAITKERGTLTWLPNFAYNLLADRPRDDDLEGVDLSSLRLAVNCSEPIRADSHDRFAARYAALGLKRTALSGCYAMAETTFAVTQTPPGEEARRVAVDRPALARGDVRPAAKPEDVRVCVSSGRPISGCQVRVVDAEGNALPEGRVGELLITSVSLFDGYRNQPAKTAEVLKEGWFRSGDLGFMQDGECYVVGRKKDIIIVAGKNLYPEDIEDAVGGVAGVIPGRVVAFPAEDATSGTEQVCLVAETEVADAPARARLKLAVLQAAMAIDVTISVVYFVPPRWLIKSSSGKPSRSANRERSLAELKPS
jgi:acyl-CoA synthetase (AMP-forming)/AMP-acid ligase II